MLSIGKKTILQRQMGLVPSIALSVLIMSGLIALVYSCSIPNPNMILIAGLVLCSAWFGFRGGIPAAVIMVGYSLFFFSQDHSFIYYTPTNAQKLFVSLVGIVSNMVFVCLLKKSERDAFGRIQDLTNQLNEENLHLLTLSLTDGLTGVRNRYALRQEYDSYRGRQVAVMMLDVDRFKEINDTLGHGEGDRILQETGALLARTFGTDNCFRYGGDEFLVICPDMSEFEFEEKLAGLKGQEPRIKGKGQEQPVAYSVGFVSAVLDTPDTLRHLFTIADERMYEQKHQRHSA